MTKPKVPYETSHIEIAAKVVGMGHPQRDWEDDAECSRSGIWGCAPENLNWRQKRVYEDEVIAKHCGGCVVRDTCLQYGVKLQEPVSINFYGGYRSDEIAKIRLAHQDLARGVIEPPVINEVPAAVAAPMVEDVVAPAQPIAA